MPKTAAHRVSEAVERHNTIAYDDQPQDAIRRAELEANPEKWLKHYLAHAYPKPFGQVHRDIITHALHALDAGGNLAIAAPRGTGKSSVMWGVALYALFSGKVRFGAYIPYAARDIKRAMRFWRTALCSNEVLAADYPLQCDPFVVSKGIPQRVRMMRYGEPYNRLCGAEMTISEGLIVLPEGCGVLGAATINGNPRGLNYAAGDGSVWRPDFILIDDPQDPEVAKSPSQIKSVLEMIAEDVMGMAGPDKRLPMCMTCTVIERGDVADTILSSPEWDSIRVPQIVTWPNHLALWDSWNEQRQAGLDAKDKGAAALAFYMEHRDALNEGASVSWAERFDPSRNEPDALYSAMWDFYRMGREAFYSERQNEPLVQTAGHYELAIEDVVRHAIALPPGHLPEKSTVFVGHVDINLAGLHWCLAAFDQSMTGHSPMYGKHPERANLWEHNAPEMVRKQAIFRGLTELCGKIAATHFACAGKPCRPGVILIDRGYEPEVVHQFCRTSAYPFKVMPARGYAAHKYFPKRGTLIGAPYENAHETSSQFGNFISFNADAWRETSQRAFLGEPGEPGGFTLFAPPHPSYHVPFAEHVTAEKLANKYKTDAGMRWEWRHAPGTHWDWGDALTGCWVAAAVRGLTTSGAPVIVRKPKSRARLQMVRV